jgi:hypothetical protein
MICLSALQSSGPYSRLASEAEVELLAQQAMAQATPVDHDEGKEFGCGKRDRGSATYKDMREREFKRLCRLVGRSLP